MIACHTFYMYILLMDMFCLLHEIKDISLNRVYKFAYEECEKGVNNWAKKVKTLQDSLINGMIQNI